MRFNDLVLAMADSWLQNGRLILLCPDETGRFLPAERDRLVDRVRSVRHGDLPEAVIPETDKWSDGGYTSAMRGSLPTNGGSRPSYWQDARRTLPVRALFVPNTDFAGPRPRVDWVLTAIGCDLSP